MEKKYDLVIIGSGPAGLTAAIYAQRARLNTLVIEKEMISGGQVLTTYEVENYPGFPGIDGFSLGTKFREHADHLGTEFATDEIQQIRLMQEIDSQTDSFGNEVPDDEIPAGKIQLNEIPVKVQTGTRMGDGEQDRDLYIAQVSAQFHEEADKRADSDSNGEQTEIKKDSRQDAERIERTEKIKEAEKSEKTEKAEESEEIKTWKVITGKKETYLAKTVILASGATHKKLGVPGEERLRGSGVSYCATCDGAFFRKKEVAVIGGGDVALEDAIFLSRMCSHVYLIHRRGELRGAKVLQEQLKALENVTILWDTVAEEICGEQRVEAISLRNVKTGERSDLAVSGVFVAVGIEPNSELLDGIVRMDRGYVCADEDCETSVPGIFAAGDVRTKQLRQIVTAASDGANAVSSAERYLNAWK